MPGRGARFIQPLWCGRRCFGCLRNILLCGGMSLWDGCLRSLCFRRRCLGSAGCFRGCGFLTDGLAWRLWCGLSFGGCGLSLFITSSMRLRSMSRRLRRASSCLRSASTCRLMGSVFVTRGFSFLSLGGGFWPTKGKEKAIATRTSVSMTPASNTLPRVVNARGAVWLRHLFIFRRCFFVDRFVGGACMERPFLCFLVVQLFMS